MMMDQAIILWKVFRTLHQMLQDRGYSIDSVLLEYTLDAFIAEYGILPEKSRLNNIYSGNNVPDIAVMFCEQETLAMNSLKKNIALLTSSKKHQHGILIGKNELASQCRKELSNYPIEFFKESELVINITRHVLVPKHELASSQDLVNLKTKIGDMFHKLPKINNGDPCKIRYYIMLEKEFNTNAYNTGARYYAFKRGDIIKITGPSETAGTNIRFRIVQ